MNDLKIRNIGLDLDGVLFDQELFVLQKRLKELENMHDRWAPVLKKLFFLAKKKLFTQEEYNYYMFWAKYIIDYLFFTELTIDARLYLNKWISENRKLHIISGRKEENLGCVIYNVLIFFTKLSIKYHKIPCDGLYFCSDSNALIEKKEWCSKLNIDLMIDNRFDVIRSLDDTCSGVCFSLHNDFVNNNGIQIVHDFSSVDCYIQTLERRRNY